MARKSSSRSKKKKNKGNLPKALFIAFLLSISLLFGITIGASYYIIHDTPDISDLYYGDIRSPEATLIYDRNGEVIHRLFREHREYVSLESMPQHLKDAVVAIEDSRFYSHHGIDFWSIPRAIVVDIRERGFVQGFSTLTMQLARNVYLTQQKLVYRKLQEMFLALQFERLYTKDEILEFYLNEAFLGHSAYGFQAAAQQYFGKDVDELTLAESAMLAGILPSPNRYSPFNNMEIAKRRQAVVLNRMEELGYITAEEVAQAREEEIELRSREEKQEDFAPYFIRYVRDELLREFGPQAVYAGGLRVYTTLDSRLQNDAEETLRTLIEEDVLPTVEREQGQGDMYQPQAAIVTLDPSTGHILSMVGGRGNDQWNRVTQSYRQPGSAFKPIIYAAALEQGLGPGTVMDDYPTIEFSGFTVANPGDEIRPWPRNFGDQYSGPITFREALNNSKNVVAVKALNEIGISNGLDMAQRLGVSSLTSDDRSLGLALGGLSRGITPLEMAQVYGVFANEGIRTEPISITKVEDHRGNIIYQRVPERSIVLAEDINYIMCDMLQTVITDGTGWRADLNRPTAGKTGTTNDYTDAWFVGFTPDLVTAVWVGEDTPRSMRYFPKLDSSGNPIINQQTGDMEFQITLHSWIAAQLWGDYMRQAVSPMPVLQFPSRPNTIEEVTICPVTGKLPGEHTPRTVTELFVADKTPEEKETYHEPIIEVEIDTKTGLLASSYCPPEDVQIQQFQRHSHIRVDSQGLPLRIFDPRTGVPKTDENGNPLYETMPESICYIHDPFHDTEQTPSEDNDFDDLWERLFHDRDDD